MTDYEIKFSQLGQLKKKQYIIIDNTICRIKKMTKSKPGKHGSAKMRVVANAVFSGQKTNLLKPTNATVKVPVMEKGTAQINMDTGDKYEVMDTNNYQTYQVDKGEFKGLKPGDQIEYLKAGKNIKIVRKK